MDSLHALEEEAQRCKNDNRFLRISSTNVDGLDEEKRGAKLFDRGWNINYLSTRD